MRVGVALFVLAAPAAAVTVPFQQSFDAAGYPTWVSNGATHIWEPSGGWQGGAARFTPPTGGQGYAGTGTHSVDGQQTRLNVRVLVYFGSRHTIDSSLEGNKFLIFNRITPDPGDDEDPYRAIVIFHSYMTSQWEVAICNNIDCTYPSPRFDISDHLEQWISFEFEVNSGSPCTLKTYVTTQDGAFNEHLLQTETCVSAGYWSGFQIAGGFFNGAATPSPNNYFKFDELAIDTRYIGPPAGFVNGPVPAAPANVR